MLAVKIISLIISIWFGVIAANDLARGLQCHWLNLFIPSAAIATFAWSMGWLS